MYYPLLSLAATLLLNDLRTYQYFLIVKPSELAVYG